MAKQHRHEIRKANERHLARMTELTSDRDGAVAEAEEIYNRRELQLIELRDKQLREARVKVSGPAHRNSLAIRAAAGRGASPL